VLWMENLGVSEAVNFREEDWVQKLTGQNFDIILDCVGWASSGDEVDRASEALRPGGQFISLTNFDLPEEVAGMKRGCIVKAVVPTASSEDLDTLVAWVASGDLEVCVDQVCPFTEARHALHESVVGQCRGKVLLCQCGASGGPRRVPCGASACGGA
ncbi:unnamed protein product, partial [Polarella glacialis]